MPAPRPVVAVLALAALVAACAQPAASAPPSPTAATPGAVASASVAPATAAVTASSPASPGASGGPTARSAPPDAMLTAGGTDSRGKLGSWALPSGGSDAPWQPAATMTEVRVATGVRLAIRFGDGTRIAAWQAVRAAAADTDGITTQGLGERAAETPPLEGVTLDPMPSGSWVVAVRLGLAGGGSATYYWFVTAS